MHTRHTMTDEQRAAAWDRVAAEMRGDLHNENDRNAIIAMCVIAAAGIVALLMLAI